MTDISLGDMTAANVDSHSNESSNNSTAATVAAIKGQTGVIII